MTDPNAHQFGGNHYKKAGNLQHWDMLVEAGYGWEYYTGNATRYLTRTKDDLLLDAQKAGHFLDKLLALIDAGCMSRVDSRFETDDFEAEYLPRYFEANHIEPTSDQANAIRLVMIAHTRDELVLAREVVGRVIAARMPADAPDDTPANVTQAWPFAPDSDPANRVFMVGDSNS